jgi:hypothetical protein
MEHMDLNRRSEGCERNRDRQLRRQRHRKCDQQLPRRHPLRSGHIRSSDSFYLKQPQPTTVDVGQQATFTVVATGTPAPTYQWLNNGNPITGATGAVYITPPTLATDNGTSFSVTVSNGSGTIPSNAALLTVTNNSGGGGTGNPPPPPPLLRPAAMPQPVPAMATAPLQSVPTWRLT